MSCEIDILISKALGSRWYCGILSESVEGSGVKFKSLAKRYLNNNPGKDVFVGMFLVTDPDPEKIGIDESDDSSAVSDLVLVCAAATRTSSSLNKEDLAKIVVERNKCAIGRLHSVGIECSWNGKADCPLFIDSQIHLEHSVYKEDSKEFQDWYYDTLVECGIDDGESEVVSRLCTDFFQKYAYLGIDPWNMDFNEICERHGMGPDDRIKESFIRKLLADLDARKRISYE